jgi:hypothetical protein
MSLQALKTFIVLLSALSTPWSLGIAYAFGAEDYTLGGILLGSYILFDILYSVVYWSLMEKMR